MERRVFLLGWIPAVLRGQEKRKTLRGVLWQEAGKKSVLQMAGGQVVALSGDAPTEGVLNDGRLAGADFEVVGVELSAGTFRVDPIHTKAMFVHKDGKRLMISYWCEVCAIRTYTPGVCMCCQEETALDLKESFEP